jgi:arsenical pump membrane protein
VAAAVLMLVVRSPALPVLALGVGVAAVGMKRASMSVGEIWTAVAPASLAGVFGIAVALGTLARSWGGPAHLMAHASSAETAALGAGTSVLVNNLPAAVLLGSRPPAHPRALLLGLNLGPNLAVTGSLSALLWFQAAKTVGARPSAARLTRLGIILVPSSIAASAVALKLFAPGRL